MKSLKETWRVEELIANKELINPRPQFQRTLVWNLEKKQKLIDSMLRGYDLPKFYMRGYDGDPYRFDITDGQQRINAIWDFHNGNYSLSKKTVIDKVDLSGKYFEELPEEFKIRYVGYVIHVTNIYEAKTEELYDLFARLQMGVSLIPTELRHATPSSIGNEIEKIITIHKFFGKEANGKTYISRIQNKRFKHQDHLDHAIALCIYGENKKDLKAKTLMELYVEFSDANSDLLKPIFTKVKSVLNIMFEINKYTKGIFRNKWGFVDYFWLIYSKIDFFNGMTKKELAQHINNFEEKRKAYHKMPERLIQGANQHKDLYDYIMAFSKEGSLMSNIVARNRVLRKNFDLS